MTKILVIEDEGRIRELVSNLLTLEDYEVVEAVDGEEGVALALNHQPDLIICDVMMPKLDGYGVLHELRNQPETEIIPFIFLTAKGTNLDFRQGMDLGADDYLTKPFTTDELLKAISTRLNKRTALQNNYATQVKKAETELTRLLKRDPLTNLLNQLALREVFEERLQEWYQPEDHERKNHLLPVLYLRLDRFERVIESFGYELSDQLLKTVARCLQNCINDKSEIARMNSDEFVIILPPIEIRQIAVDTAQKIISRLAQPFLLADKEVFVPASIGITFYPRESRKLEELLRQAKMAMEQVEKLGGNQSKIYTMALQNSQSANLLELETDLRHALENKEFEVYYQPQVNLSTGKIVGAEALIRWYHPEKGLISPNKFIPLAEETGLIAPIGEWVLETACEEAYNWQKENLGLLRIAVNLSSRQFDQMNLHLRLAEIIKKTGLEPRFLDLEVTERTLISNPILSQRKLEMLKALGVQISMDDFGTGYSSLNYLQKFRLDILKIDPCFVRDLPKNEKNHAIVQSVINLAHQLNFKVIAEGVETEAEVEILRKYECDEIQGYFFGRPMTGSEFRKLVKVGKYLSLSA